MHTADKKNILVFEPQKKTLNALAILLEQEGHQVLKATGKDSLLRLLAESEFDSVIIKRSDDMDLEEIVLKISKEKPLCRITAFDQYLNLFDNALFTVKVKSDLDTQPVDIKTLTGPWQIIAERYQIIDLLGKGGMGNVFLARDMKLQEDVAVKILKRDLFNIEQKTLDLFKQEIKTARQISHKNIIRTYEFDEFGDDHFVTMEYFAGSTLKEFLEKRRRLRLELGITIIRQLCAALVSAHNENIVHSDVKPENILINKRFMIKILDFGIARLQNKNFNPKEMASNRVIGTPHYMSPEQCNSMPYDLRSDIYSLGILMYELFSGQLPFYGQDTISILLKHLNEKPKPPRELNMEIPLFLNDMILKCLEKDPAARYQSVSEIMWRLLKYAK